MNSGEIADFSNCKFFLTGDTLEEKSMGFSGSKEAPRPKISPDLSKYFTSNIFFSELTKRDLRRVLWSKLNQMNKKFAINDIKLVYDFKLIKNFVDKVDREDNAIQALNKEFENKIKKRVATAILDGKTTINLEKLLTFD